MNHDISHCLDYDKNTCPEHCFRARATKELYEIWATPSLRDEIPYASFVHFKGTMYCEMDRPVKED